MPRLALDTLAALGWRYFASGCNHPGEVLGFDSCGVSAGITVAEMRRGLLAAVQSTRLPVFVDSGAFSEVVFDPAPRVRVEITAGEWRRRLAVYAEIATALGPRAFVVAPDCVAFQAESLRRLREHASQVREIAQTGARVLIPCQKGALRLSDFWTEAQEILQVPDPAAAIPMKKDATNSDDLRSFVQVSRPSRMHLLGLGAKSARLPEMLELLRDVAHVSLDSALIPSLVGRTNGRGGGPRPLTMIQDQLRAAGAGEDLKRRAIVELLGYGSSTGIA